jgi:thioredoxin 1
VLIYEYSSLAYLITRFLKNAVGTVFVDFNAKWCPPCRQIEPTVEKLAEETPEVKFYSLDVDEVAEVATSEGIRAVSAQ